MSSLLTNNRIFNKIYQLIDLLEQKMLTDEDIKRKEMLDKFDELNKKMEQIQSDYYNLFSKYIEINGNNSNDNNQQ